MKRILLVLLSVLIGMFLIQPVFADRNIPTIKGFTTTQLIKRGDAKVYRIEFIATANGGEFSLHDVILDESISVADGSTTIKTEGKEATSGNSKVYDFTNKPLEFSTGLYLRIGNGTMVIQYE